MQGTRFAVFHHTVGTLAANQSLIFKFPFPVTLLSVSAAGSNANNAIIDVGYTAALEAYVKDMDCGDSSVAAILDSDTDFEGDVFPHIAALTNIIVTVDYDGAGGTAVNDFSICLTFSEG